MGGSENKIQLVVEAYSNAKGTLDELGKQIKGLGDSAVQTGQKHDSVFQKMKENWIAISVVALEVKKAVQEAWEYMAAGAKAQQAEETFRSVAAAAGESADRILEKMREAANGTMDDSAIMQKAAKGMIQGLSGDQMVNIMAAARVAARTTGQDVSTAYETITDAIANKMPRALLQYGLVTKEQMKLLNASMAAGITTVDLYALATANAADQARKLGGAQTNNAETLQHWKAVLEEIKEYIGKTFWDAFNAIDSWFKKNPQTIREWAAALVEAFTVVKAEIMRLSMLLDKIGGSLTSAGMLLFAPGAAMGNENSKKQFEKMADANMKFEERYNATDKELQTMAVELDKRLQGILKPTSAKSDVAAPWLNKPPAPRPSGPTAEELEAQMKANLARKEREALIQLQIADVDIEEKNRDISHVDAAQKRVDLAEELLKTQEANLSLIDKEAVGGSASWTAQSKAIEETKKKISDFRLALRELNGDFQTGFNEGLKRYIDTVGSTFQQAVKLAEATAQAMESAFSNFFFDVMTGKLKSLWDYVQSFLLSVAHAIANMMAQQVASGIIGSIAGPSGGPLPGFDPTKHHSGGLIMHQGGYVPRFHVGGLMSDERPAILQTGEGVLSRKGMAALDALNNGQAGGGIKFTMNVNNQTGTPIAAKNTGVQFDGEKFVVSVFLNQIESYGPVRAAIEGLK